MIGRRGAVRAPDGQRQHDEREDRQQMDRAPGTDQRDLVDPERAAATAAISSTQIQPSVRCGKVPLAQRLDHPSIMPSSPLRAEVDYQPGRHRTQAAQAHRSRPPIRHELDQAHVDTETCKRDPVVQRRWSREKLRCAVLERPTLEIPALRTECRRPCRCCGRRRRLRPRGAGPPLMGRRSRNRRLDRRGRNCRRRHRCGRRAWSAPS